LAQQARAAEEANAANAERVADLEAQLEILGSQLAAESRAREALQTQLDGLGDEASQVGYHRGISAYPSMQVDTSRAPRVHTIQEQ
jgi:Tfp pilus assembly protein FimV